MVVAMPCNEDRYHIGRDSNNNDDNTIDIPTRFRCVSRTGVRSRIGVFLVPGCVDCSRTDPQTDPAEVDPKHIRNMGSVSDTNDVGHSLWYSVGALVHPTLHTRKLLATRYGWIAHRTPTLGTFCCMARYCGSRKGSRLVENSRTLVDPKRTICGRVENGVPIKKTSCECYRGQQCSCRCKVI